MAPPVALNFRRAETYNTWPGALLTIVTKLIVFGYMLHKFEFLYNKLEPDSRQYVVQKTLEGRGPYKLHESRYNLAFAIVR